MDKARQKTDKRLKSLEAEIGKVYKNDLALKRLMKKYEEYMKGVQKDTEHLYLAFVHSDDKHKAEAKQEYKKAVLERTQGSKKYRILIADIVRALATTNQRALDLANDMMEEVYAENYNQVAVDCRKAGIKVDGF